MGVSKIRSSGKLAIFKCDVSCNVAGVMNQVEDLINTDIEIFRLFPPLYAFIH
jgi:hypothetical protein